MWESISQITKNRYIIFLCAVDLYQKLKIIKINHNFFHILTRTTKLTINFLISSIQKKLLCWNLIFPTFEWKFCINYFQMKGLTNLIFNFLYSKGSTRKYFYSLQRKLYSISRYFNWNFYLVMIFHSQTYFIF